MRKLTCFLHTPQPHIDANSVVLPYLWATFKTYYEHQSPHHACWYWITPEISPTSVDDWKAKLIQYDHIDVVGMSQYVWNHDNDLHELCMWIKERHPNCIIAFGGPQPNVRHTFDYFRSHRHVDVVCDQSGYGELFWTSLLDQIATGTYDPSTIPYAIYPDDHRMQHTSPVLPYKRDFMWYPNPYVAQSPFIEPFIEYAHRNEKYVKASVEGTRGCPYTCTFCDWGGGTGTKVIIKPYDQLVAEYHYLIERQVLVINVMDANLGIIERDVDLIADIIRIRDSFRHNELQLTLLGLAKADKRHVNKILEMCADAGLIQEHFVSAQSFNDVTLDAIRRKDPPWRQQVHDLEPIRQKHPDFAVRLQVITGLPESTLDEFYTWFDVLHDYGTSIISAYWLLLPATPAYDPKYVSKYGLKLSKYKAFMHTSLRRVHADQFDVRGVIEYPIVTGSNTYTTNEWEEMIVVAQFMAAAMDVKWLPNIMKRLHDRTHRPYSVLYRRFVDECLKLKDSPLHLWYANQLQVLRQGGILDAYCLPVDDGYLYCGEAYWTQMMCTDAEWMPVVRKWATEQLNVNERTDDESK